MISLGVHMPPQGATERAFQTAFALKSTCVLWLAMDIHGPHQPHDAARYPNAVHFVRLPNPGLQEAAGAYADRVQPIIAAWRTVVPDAYYVIGNEPEHEAGWPVDAWLTTLPLFAAVIRADFGGIKLAATPFLVDNAAAMTQRVAQQFDAICCHTYWGFEAPQFVTDPAWGRNYLPLLAYGPPVYVTEVNASPANLDPATNWHERNRQVAQWIGQARDDGVAGCCLYLADGQGEWAGYDVGPEAALDILDQIPPLPTPPPPSPEPSPMNPYAYDGDYTYATFTAMVAGALSRKNPSVVSRENYLAVHAAAKQRNISVATLLGWIVAENVDPDLIAVNNLAGIYYVGQSRATPGPLGPANEGGKPYCAFATLTDFWVTLAINIETIDPDAWNRGDLRSIARTYTGGAQGYAKVDIVDALRDGARFPHGTVEQTPSPHRYQIVTPVDCPVAQGSDGDFSHGGVTPGFFAIDYACARGTPCRAAADGTVGVIYTTDWNPVSARTGPSVWIDHDCGYSTFSCHLSRIDVASDGRVTQGQTIGLTGDPAIDGGFGSGAHLHWEIWDTARHVRVRMEDLEAAGIAGPWDGGSQEEQIDMHVDGKFDDGRIKRLWDGPKTKTAIRTVGGYSDQRGIDARWLAELQAGKPVGFAVSNEESIPTGGKIRYFSNGFICSYPDGSTSVC
jgi:murein DD-endopeptidase MepM/ murein hydrolase activator NlpD